MKAEQYEKELIEAIQKYNWMRWSHIDWRSLNMGRTSAYSYKLNESDTVKEAFELNRSKGVNYLLQKWMNSDNATLQIAAMRIIADDEDRQRLNQQYVDHTSKGQEIKPSWFN
jgi:hypothetical protein